MNPVTVMNPPTNLTERQKFRVATHVHSPDGVCIKVPVGQPLCTPNFGMTEKEANDRVDENVAAHVEAKAEKYTSIAIRVAWRVFLLRRLFKAASDERPASAIAWATIILVDSRPRPTK